jgi:hypothetical protein
MSRRVSPLAGFQVTINGRFWVIAEAHFPPPFDKYIEVLDGHEIVFSLRNPNPNNQTLISYQPFVVDNVKMLVCAKVGNICLFHPAGHGKSTKALEIIISFFNPDLEECLPDPTPSWGEELIATIPGTKEIKTRISEIDGKIEGLKRRRDTDEEELQALSEWGQLLWLTGIPLQRLVQKAFKYLGFEIEPRPETGHTEDFVAKYGSAVYLIEATGSAGSITIDKGRQLMQWVISSEFEKCHGILVGNAFSKEPPEKRPPTPNHHVFTPDLKQFAEKYDFSLLDTWELFRAVCAKLAHQPTPIESLCTALSKVGAVEFPDRAENKQAT